MHDKKIFLLVFIPLMTTVIVANSTMQSDDKSFIFALSAFCMLIAGYMGINKYFVKKNK